MAGKEEFNQTQYWLDRHENYYGDPRSVGNAAATLEANRQGELEFKEAMSEVAVRLSKFCKSVLDLGCGYGRVADCFLDEGYNYTGLDVSSIAIEQARRDYSGGKFEEVDLLKWRASSKYDLVCALFVMVHFVKDSDWIVFLNNTLKSVKKGGFVLIADNFPAEGRQSATHYVARPFAEYESVLINAGFAIDLDISKRIQAVLPDNKHVKYLRFARLK